MAAERLRELEEESSSKGRSDEPPVKRSLLKARDYTVSTYSRTSIKISAFSSFDKDLQENLF